MLVPGNTNLVSDVEFRPAHSLGLSVDSSQQSFPILQRHFHRLHTDGTAHSVVVSGNNSLEVSSPILIAHDRKVLDDGSLDSSIYARYKARFENAESGVHVDSMFFISARKGEL